ncbi:cob(I)yrinic acid a,c-diamide adenosyltransferase [Paenibacillus caui]|uniref:cob(I)yrinic acid a,c-diamide adenosyltransferase n=1 Tax=Paenibacillus caui TaxID=2873927 RepID=UPI001CA9E9DC|nr:cob(I)yrinic acid a,c-diamide adenosyltransferase [Paenibacillus caui]
MKMYTRSGDKGQTSAGFGRVRKDDDRVEAYGTIDELNSFVGQAAALAEVEGKLFDDLKGQLIRIQHELFDCGSDLAFVERGKQDYKVQAEMAKQLELWMDAYEEENPPLERFILPGGSLLAATLHVCRTVCRRAERRTVTMAGSCEANPEVIRYLNRLSDYLFVAARLANTRAGKPETEYERSGKVFR